MGRWSANLVSAADPWGTRLCGRLESLFSEAASDIPCQERFVGLNRGEIEQTDELLAAIQALNRGQVKIHAVSLGDEPHELLPKLAKQNGGRYVARPFPK